MENERRRKRPGSRLLSLERREMKRRVAALLMVVLIPLSGAVACQQAVEDRVRNEVEKKVQEGEQRAKEELRKGQKRAEKEARKAQKQIERGAEKVRKQAEKKAGQR